ncbi:MAG: M1 family metallopeptidase [Flavobacteriales bacterium]|nr:M1 family metallopeptidase [Flavobacteriales bacterium]
MSRNRAKALATALFLLLSPAFLSAQYFQQQVDYRINVRLDDVKHELFAIEEFDYLNNSSQTLDTIWIHFWPNANKDQSTALCEQLDRQNNFRLHFATPAQRGFIDSLDFRSNDTKLTWGFHSEHIDIGWIKLPAPLTPGARITISTPFHVKSPSASFSRLGHAGQAYYITQWFPKPAVYDREGWHAMPYLTQGEFYSEFGSFDVSITLPANYVVAATGELQNAQEVAFMDSLAGLTFTGSRRHRWKQWASFPSSKVSSAQVKTIRFKQDRVHDFAWFADKTFIVRKGSVTLPRRGNTVTTWTLFTPKNATVWDSAITYVNESVRLYSQWVGDYPYSACTAIDGGTAAGGGMEYPMITIINDSEDAFELDVVIAHEVGHNWFYGMLGSNERDHPWMDEGINSFYEQRYVENATLISA